MQRQPSRETRRRTASPDPWLGSRADTVPFSLHSRKHRFHAWLHRNQTLSALSQVDQARTCAGRPGRRGHHVQKSRQGNAEVDRAAAINVLKNSGTAFDVREFDPYGHDERQYYRRGLIFPSAVFRRLTVNSLNTTTLAEPGFHPPENLPNHLPGVCRLSSSGKQQDT